MRRFATSSLCLALTLSLGSASGCKGAAEGAEPSPKQGEAEPGDSDGAEPDSSDASSPSGMNPAAFGGLAQMLKKGLDEPGLYDEPKSSKDFDEAKPHWLAYELDDPVVELGSVSMFGGALGTPLRKLSDRLGKAAQNPEVQGLLLRIGGTSMSMATAEELRGHLLAFKGGGERTVACHAEGLGNMTMYLASVCDELSLAPLGGVSIPGPAMGPVHIKGMLDKLGVTADFIHVGAFKSGPEPLTREAPSPESLEVFQSLVDSAYARMVAGIAEGRELERAKVESAFDHAMFVAAEAKENGLIDRIETYEDFRVRTLDGAQWTRMKLEKSTDFDDPMALQRFLGIVPPKMPDEPHVALVYAVGNVIDGRGQGITGATSEIASRPLASALRALAADDQVQAVVLRVDSPGGSALASEQIHLASLELAAKKPFVVSMGSVAASGGYYISAGATRIYAQPDTLTGSIGVFGGKIAMREAFEKVGVKSYEVKASKRATMWGAMDPWSEGEREVVRASMQQTYDRFLDRVAAGRKMTRDAVHEVAQGRVWTGEQARERGLVDELGGLDEAIAKARELGSVDPEIGLQVYPPDPTLKDLLASLGSGSSPLGVHAAGGLDAATFAMGQLAPNVAAQVEGQLRMVMSLHGTHVWAAHIVPTIRD